jgi:Flp pilus assembly protein CpaB
MRRSRTLILVLLIIVICIIVGFVAVNQFLLAPSTPDVTEQQPTYVEIYIAEQNIAQGSQITEQMLGTIEIPLDSAIPTLYTRDELPILLGKIARYPIDQGTPISETMVTDSAQAVAIAGPQWASLIPPTMTAISIPANRLSLAGFAVSDGAHVNVNACLLFVDVDPSYQTILPNLTAVLTGTGFGSVRGADDTGFSTEGLPVLSLGVAASGAQHGRLELDPSVQQPYYLIPSELQRPRLVCQTILQDVVVLKTGDFAVTPATEPTQQDGQQAPPPATEPDLVTLIVSPQDSITLSYLIYTNAQISLALRNPSDNSRQQTEASTLQFLLSQYNIPVPAKLPYAMQPALTTLAPPVLTNSVQEP